MDIMIPNYIIKGQRVLSTECIFCQTCVNVCPHQTLTVSLGVDMGGKDLLTPRVIPASMSPQIEIKTNISGGTITKDIFAIRK